MSFFSTTIRYNHININSKKNYKYLVVIIFCIGAWTKHMPKLGDFLRKSHLNWMQILNYPNKPLSYAIITWLSVLFLIKWQTKTCNVSGQINLWNHATYTRLGAFGSFHWFTALSQYIKENKLFVHLTTPHATCICLYLSGFQKLVLCRWFCSFIHQLKEEETQIPITKKHPKKRKNEK